MARFLRWMVFGAVLEIIVLVFSIPRDSTQPETGFQLVAAYTQAPGLVVARLVSGLPAIFSVPLDVLALALACIVQAALFALPLWLFSIWWNGRVR
jgi:hypothetical protein